MADRILTLKVIDIVSGEEAVLTYDVDAKEIVSVKSDTRALQMTVVSDE